MSRHKDKGRIEGPFVPMLVDTMASPAWKAMSPHARVVYIALRSHYSHKIRNNCRIYISARDGAEETGFNMKTVARCLRELRHYGFIVLTKPHALGVGTATHWRLTELGYMHDPPTKDFLKWDGELFHEQKTPAYYKRQERHFIPVYQGAEQLPEKVFQRAVHISEPACTSERYISRVNHSAVLTDAPASVVFQPPAVRPDCHAVANYLAAWTADETTLA
jgi:hypothetical protein